MPYKDIVEFALYCAEDCQQFDNKTSSPEVKDCNKASQDFINHVKLWLNNNKPLPPWSLKYLDAANALARSDNFNEAVWFAHRAARLTLNLAQNADSFMKATNLRSDVKREYQELLAHHAANIAEQAEAAQASFDDGVVIYKGKLAEYTKRAQFIRNHSIQSNIQFKPENFFDQNGDIDEVSLRILIFDHLEQDNDHQLIQKVGNEFVFMLQPHFFGSNEEEVFQQIVKSKTAKQNILAHLK